jgi:hypothetical protein
MIDIINSILLEFFRNTMNFLPSLLSGLFIIIVGFLVGGLLKKVLLSLFSFFKLDSLFQKTRLIEKKEVKVWEEILTELLRWTIFVLFLVPTLEIWGLSRATVVLNQFLFYIPNVIVAVIIAFVGLVTSNLGADIVKSSARTMGTSSAATLSVLTKWLIVFFTVLVVLNQLGVAQDLIRILFTGIVVMIALAGGLAFGLGGQTIAKDILEELRNKLK